MDDVVIDSRYRLRERLGAGAMSEVWLADDDQLERSVAVKLLSPHGDSLRFEREARAAATLSHPNVARIYAYGEEGGRPYMVLEHLPGGTLEDRLTYGRPLPDAETTVIAEQLAAGLAHAHEHGLVHRDLKPSNVLFDTEGRAKIADFGIARVEGLDTMTEVGTVMGTASYISPEQAGGEPASPASDVYSFGVILFRLLTGRLPFEGESPLAVTAMHRTERPPPIFSLRADAPPDLAALAAAAMAKDPRARPADGSALVTALDGGVPATAEAQTMVLPRPPARQGRRRAWIAALIGGAVLLAVGAAAAILLTAGDDSGASTTHGTSTHAPSTSAPTSTTVPTTTTATTTTQPTTTEATTTEPPTTTTEPTTTEAPPTTTETPTTTTSDDTTVTVPPPP